MKRIKLYKIFNESLKQELIVIPELAIPELEIQNMLDLIYDHISTDEIKQDLHYFINDNVAGKKFTKFKLIDNPEWVEVCSQDSLFRYDSNPNIIYRVFTKECYLTENNFNLLKQDLDFAIKRFRKFNHHDWDVLYTLKNIEMEYTDQMKTILSISFITRMNIDIKQIVENHHIPLFKKEFKDKYWFQYFFCSSGLFIGSNKDNKFTTEEFDQIKKFSKENGMFAVDDHPLIRIGNLFPENKDIKIKIT